MLVGCEIYDCFQRLVDNLNIEQLTNEKSRTFRRIDCRWNDHYS